MTFLWVKARFNWEVNNGKSIYYIQHNLEKLFVQSRPPRFRQKPNGLKLLTLFSVCGGHNGPDDHKQLYSLYKIMARATKILDFVPFYFWMFTGELFLDFFFWNFEKIKKKIDSCDFKGSPFEKNAGNFKKCILCSKFCFYS